MARTLNTTFEGPDRAIALRVYYPVDGARLPALVYLHGGGWTLLGIETHDRIMREYAALGPFIVVGMDYALAPENPFPCALHECMALVSWLTESGDRLALDRDLIAVGGDSSGANLALATCLALRDQGRRLPKAMLLNYGAYDCDFGRDSYQRHGSGEFLLSKELMAWFWSNYVPRAADRTHPFATPLHANLSALPPAFIVIGDVDVLRDENLLMAQRMKDSRGDVTAIVYPGTIHAFLEAVRIVDVSGQAIRDGAAWLNEKLVVRPKRRMPSVSE